MPHIIMNVLLYVHSNISLIHLHLVVITQVISHSFDGHSVIGLAVTSKNMSRFYCLSPWPLLCAHDAS